MGANQGSRNSPNSWSFNFRFIPKHPRLAAFALMAAVLLSPGKSEAQAVQLGSSFSWSRCGLY